MKKIISLSLVALLVFSLTACGDPKVSKKAISCGTKALEVADDYIDETIDANKAREKLDELKSEMEYVDDMSQDDENKAGDFSVQSGLSVLSSAILNDSITDDDKSYLKVKDARDNLAKDIGKK